MGEPLVVWVWVGIGWYGVDAREHSGHKSAGASRSNRPGRSVNGKTRRDERDGQGPVLSNTPGPGACSQLKGV